jgi:hypothetical protein
LKVYFYRLSIDVAYRFAFLGKVTTEDFLRNVGFDTIKLDRHITRWLTRMGALEAHSFPDEVLATMRTIADAAGMTKTKADAVVYLFCADRKDVLSGGICGNVPACGLCPLGNLCPRIGLDVAGTEFPKKSENLPPQSEGPVAGQQTTTGRNAAQVVRHSASSSTGSVGAKIYTAMSLAEILKKNPFANRTWLEEPVRLTQYRKEQIQYLFRGKTSLSRDYLHSLPRNDGCYRAFRAIAHGLARWEASSQEVVLLGVQG